MGSNPTTRSTKINKTEAEMSRSYFLSGESMYYAFLALFLLVNIFIFGLLLAKYAVLRYIEKHPPTDTIMNTPCREIYCQRWILWPHIDTNKSTWDPRHKFAIIINRFYGPDLDPPHNHMSWNMSLAVDGMGYERSPGKNVRTLRAFEFRFRSSKFQHCIDSFSQFPLTTIFITGLNMNSKWGFWEGGKFTEAKVFKGTKTFKQ